MGSGREHTAERLNRKAGGQGQGHRGSMCAGSRVRLRSVQVKAPYLLLGCGWEGRRRPGTVPGPGPTPPLYMPTAQMFKVVTHAQTISSAPSYVYLLGRLLAHVPYPVKTCVGPVHVFNLFNTWPATDGHALTQPPCPPMVLKALWL